MVLKDWKKVGDNSWMKKNGVFLNILMFDDKGKIVFGLNTDSKPRPKQKYFKTKKQVLKHARAYMKKH